MGYRSTFITDDVSFEFSEEFFERYKDRYNFADNRNLPISSKYEIKRWWDALEEDIVEELKNKNYDWRILAVWLHEDGMIDRIVFTKEGVFDYREWKSDF